MKRPVGFTILSLLLFWLAFGAVANLFMGYKTLDMKVLTIAYGLTACATAVGLWRFQNWAYKAFLSWSAVVLLLTLNFQFGAAGMFHVPAIAFIPWVLFVVLLLYALSRYIKARLTSTAAAG